MTHSILNEIKDAEAAAIAAMQLASEEADAKLRTAQAEADAKIREITHRLSNTATSDIATFQKEIEKKYQYLIDEAEGEAGKINNSFQHKRNEIKALILKMITAN
jgi:vacuolar-type H+-ATPase subunit H